VTRLSPLLAPASEPFAGFFFFFFTFPAWPATKRRFSANCTAFRRLSAMPVCRPGPGPHQAHQPLHFPNLVLFSFSPHCLFRSAFLAQPLHLSSIFSIADRKLYRPALLLCNPSSFIVAQKLANRRHRRWWLQPKKLSIRPTTTKCNDRHDSSRFLDYPHVAAGIFVS